MSTISTTKRFYNIYHILNNLCVDGVQPLVHFLSFFNYDKYFYPFPTFYDCFAQTTKNARLDDHLFIWDINNIIFFKNVKNSKRFLQFNKSSLLSKFKPKNSEHIFGRNNKTGKCKLSQKKKKENMWLQAKWKPHHFLTKSFSNLPWQKDYRKVKKILPIYYLSISNL